VALLGDKITFMVAGWEAVIIVCRLSFTVHRQVQGFLQSSEAGILSCILAIAFLLAFFQSSEIVLVSITTSVDELGTFSHFDVVEPSWERRVARSSHRRKTADVIFRQGLALGL